MGIRFVTAEEPAETVLAAQVFSKCNSVVLSSFRAGRFDAVVADIDMPKLDGIQLLRR